MLTVAGAAHAATVTGPFTFGGTISATVAAQQVCRVSGIVPINYNVNDGGGTDRIASNFTYADGTRVNPGHADSIIGAGVGFGFPTSIVADLPAGFTSNPSQPVYLTVWEVTGTNTIGAQLAQVAVPRSSLIASGGNCLGYAPNQAPIASAGSNFNALGGAPVSLAGTASDGDGDGLSYSWVQTAGPSVSISGANTLTPSFTPAVNNGPAIPYSFRLSVSDGIQTTLANVTVQVANNAPPTVNAGPDQNVSGGASVSLEGTATDPESDPMTFVWTQTAGPGVTLNNATSLTPSFIAPGKTAAPQLLTFSLVANDGTSNSLADTIDVTVAGNLGPVANAGTALTTSGGQVVVLDGGASTDGDGDTLSYSWVQTAGPPVTLTGANTRTPSFISPIGLLSQQTLTFELTVNDGVASSVASIDVNVLPNAVPVANAGPDQGPINTGQTVTLNGSASSDPDNNPLTYSWTQVSGPAVTLSNANSANPTFVAPNVTGTQNLVFELIVNDGTVDSAPDTVVIAVRAVGTITVIQRVVGADGTFSYTSDINALTGTIVTSGGTGQRSATLVPAGAHSVTAADARAAGYVVTAISCNDGDSVVNLANRSVAIALSPNENLVCTFTSTNTREAALVAISNFLTARNAALLANQPELQRRLDRLSGADSSGGSATAYGLPVPGAGRLPLSASITPDRARASTSLGTVRAAAGMDRSATPFDIWAEATFGSLDFDNKDGRFSVIYAGADYRLGKSLLIGGLVQFDRYSPQGARTAGTASGDGWMAGPYVTARLAPNLYADVRAAWGKSDNTISPLGTYVDSFETSRSLYSASLIGQFNIGSATQFRPEIAIRHIDERQKAYLDNFGVPIPGQTVSQGDIAFRPRFHHDFTVGDGWTLRPFIAGDGIYTYGLERQTVFTDQFRMRIEGGMELFSSGSFRAGLSGFHDGIGSDNFKSTGGRVSVSFGF